MPPWPDGFLAPAGRDCNGQDAEAFDGRIEFAIKLLPYTGSHYWIEGVLIGLNNYLLADEIPNKLPECDFCSYALARAEIDLD